MLSHYLSSYARDGITFKKLLALFGKVFTLQNIGDIRNYRLDYHAL